MIVGVCQRGRELKAPQLRPTAGYGQSVRAFRQVVVLALLRGVQRLRLRPNLAGAETRLPKARAAVPEPGSTEPLEPARSGKLGGNRCYAGGGGVRDMGVLV